ncbi:MAG: AtpZ/AtpI family protein [Clostridiales bacterium]|nr:AtpZ/AtpI family protein [Clostridiales bacterium]
MKYNKNVYNALMMVSQFGINMLVPIFLCSVIGIFIDEKCGTDIWVIILFFVGAAAGFKNVMRFAKKIYEVPAETRRRKDRGRKDERDGEEPEDKN